MFECVHILLPLEMNIHLLIKLGCLSTPLLMELSRTVF